MKYFIFNLLLMVTFFNTYAQNNWVLEKDKNGIKVWTKKRDGSKLKEFKGVTLMKTSVDELVAVFKNYKKHDLFMYKCTKGSVTVVKKNNDNDFYTYMTIAAPIVKDRDVVTHYKFTQEKDGSVTISIEGAPDVVPVKSDYVRVTETKGYWKFIPKDNNTVEVINQAYSSPGGSVPDALANSASVDAPYYMLENLRKLVEE
jgi:predicted choloylglycine hydrolase